MPTLIATSPLLRPAFPARCCEVLVDDNNRVRKGDVLVELDPEPFRVQVAIKAVGG